MEIYSELKASVIAVNSVPFEEVSKYGIIRFITKFNNNIIQIDTLVEKPNVDQFHSNTAIIGRYILTIDILIYLRSSRLSRKGSSN